MDPTRDIFASSARELARRGLAPIPVGGDDGKKPLVIWPRSRPKPDGQALAKWMEQHPSANVGILTKLSDVTIVDIDAPEVADEMERRFGKSPLVTRTPSGGLHFWYRANGERSRNLRRTEGVAVDVKAGGESRGGFVVVPPSMRLIGPNAGKAYQFEQGGWDDLAQLPTVRPGSLLEALVEPAKRSLHQEFADGAGIGSRNDTLFHLLKNTVWQYSNIEELEHAAAQINRGFNPPLPEYEVMRTARSVWGYRQRDEIWTDGKPRVTITIEQLTAFQGNANALMLETLLRLRHSVRDEPFAISAKAMHESEVISGWGIDRYVSARDALLALGRVRQVHRGGNGPHDPSLYKLK